MEFLKSCTTNVHALENVSRTQCSFYESENGALWDGQRWKLTRSALLELRKRDIICTTDSDGVWVFEYHGTKPSDFFRPSGYGLTLASKTTLDLGQTHRTPSGSTISEVYLRAIEAAISFKLARQCGIVHAGPWTWICLNEAEYDHGDQEAVLIKLRVNLSVSGTLYLATETTTATLRLGSSSQSKDNEFVILIPRGIRARLLPKEPRSQLEEVWYKQLIESYLESEGIGVASDEEWCTVNPEGSMKNTCLAWPARLCLSRSVGTTPRISESADAPDWQRWFSSREEDMFRNPLAMAEEWFKDTANRERAIHEAARQEVGDVPPNEYPRNGGLIEVGDSDVNATTSSPLAPRTNDQQISVSGIYPTPPDGLAQPSSNTQLVSENSMSTNQNDQPGSAIDLALGDDVLQPLQTHGRDSIGSAFQQEFALQSDDLFGDRNEELELADNAVDDADFSFFDEPDDDRGPVDEDDINMLEAPETTMNLDIESTQQHDSEVLVKEHESEDPVPSAIHDQPLGHPTTDPSIDEASRHLDNTSLQTEPLPEVKMISKPEKPLSPFGIRERLLPPPVPASIAQSDTIPPWEQRRNSSFAPVKFREGFNLGSKYIEGNFGIKELHDSHGGSNLPNIGLPKRKKYHQAHHDDQSQNQSKDNESESEEDSYESSSPSEKENDLPPKLPWDSKKRKRYPEIDPGTPFQPFYERNVPDVDGDHGNPTRMTENLLFALFDSNFASDQKTDGLDVVLCDSSKRNGHLNSIERDQSSTSNLPSMKNVFDWLAPSKQDLICIAQIVSEQPSPDVVAQTLTRNLSRPVDENWWRTNGTTYASFDKILRSLFPDLDSFDVTGVASTREPLGRPTPVLKHQPGQPRPVIRSDSTVLGPDYFPIIPPYVRIQRGLDNWEMLPTCLSFWETLGLGPAGGPKNVTAFCVCPANDHLQRLVALFMIDLSAAYESCKLGSHSHGQIGSINGRVFTYESGLVPVDLGDSSGAGGAFKAYAAACVSLGKALAHDAELKTDRNLVIYLFNPFQGPHAAQFLCACFWLLFKTYRNYVTKLQRTQVCDIVLQLLPIAAVASFDELVMHQAKDMAILAREVYDRCPPSPARSSDNSSSLPMLTAPSVALASSAPKRPGFQLTLEPPSDLLHEGSILHLAYAMSPDGKWLSASWVDNFGQHFATASYCLRGRSLADISLEVWERTQEILAARQVTWRVFIVTPEKIDKNVLQLWRTVCGKPRRQALTVTFLTVQLEPVLRLRPSVPVIEQSSMGGQDSSLFTPASTPQGAVFTNSPDVTGHGNAPPTPAPSESATALAETDPDAHLTDLTDDSWAMLLSPKLSELTASEGLASGFLFKRGDDDTSSNGIPSIGVNLRWIIQVKPHGGVDEGSARHAEPLLREVLMNYRNLTVLTKARGFDKGQISVVPIHVATAIRGADNLDALLP